MKDLETIQKKTWLREPEAVIYTGVSRSTLQRYRNYNGLQFSKINGRTVMYKRSDIDNFFKQHSPC